MTSDVPIPSMQFIAEHFRGAFTSKHSAGRQVVHLPRESLLLPSMLPPRESFGKAICVPLWDLAFAGDVSDQVCSPAEIVSSVAVWVRPDDAVLVESAVEYTVSEDTAQPFAARFRRASVQPDVPVLAAASGLRCTDDRPFGVIASESALCRRFPDNYRYRRLIDWLSIDKKHCDLLIALERVVRSLFAEPPAPFRLYALEPATNRAPQRAAAAAGDTPLGEALRDIGRYADHWRPTVLLYIWETRFAQYGISAPWEQSLGAEAAATLRTWRRWEEMDRTALELARSWHQAPGIKELFQSGGLDLSSTMEYESMQGILEQMMHAFDEQGVA